MKGLLTPTEAAELLKVKESTIKTYLRAGELKGLKLGTRWRIAPEDLQAFIDKKWQDTQNNEGQTP